MTSPMLHGDREDQKLSVVNERMALSENIPPFFPLPDILLSNVVDTDGGPLLLWLPFSTTTSVSNASKQQTVFKLTQLEEGWIFLGASCYSGIALLDEALVHVH